MTNADLLLLIVAGFGIAYPLARALDRWVERMENARYLARTKAAHNEAVMPRARVVPL